MEVNTIRAYAVITFVVSNVSKKHWRRFKKPDGWRAVRQDSYVRFRCFDIKSLGYMTPERAEQILHLLILMKNKQET